MASKYSKEFKIPKDFPSVLKAFTREVLRSQPASIYEFGAQYFADLAHHQQREEQSNIRRLTPAELEDLLMNLFIENDTDHNGFLDHTEFKKVLHMANLGLSDKDVARIMAEADENDDGVIEYKEFIPVAVDLVQGLYAKMDARAEAGQQSDAAREQAQNYMLHGMPREQLEVIMLDVFKKADADGSGRLSRREFLNCIKEADLGLTRREINVVMAEVDNDGDGMITYEEFAPLCFDILCEILKDEILTSQRTPSQLEEFLMDLFRSADPEDTGLLRAAEIRDLIRSADFGLTRLQIHSILSEGTEDANGCIEYAKFSHGAADLIYRLLDTETQRERALAMERMKQSDDSDVNLVHNMQAPELEAALTRAFQSVDTDSSGVLDRVNVRRALEAAGLGLSSKEIACLMSATDEDSDGNILYEPLAQYAFTILHHLSLEEQTNRFM